jgi:hypothetical protein
VRESTAGVVGLMVSLVLPAALFSGSAAVNWGYTDPISIILGFTIGYFYSGAFAFPFAVAAFVVGRRLRLIRWWSTIITGFAIGAIVILIVGYRAPIKLSTVAIYALIGAASALMFWVIWEQRASVEER